MMMVRCILVETTRPVRIRPRIETRPVKGHFLSATRNSGQPKPFPFFILETSSMTISSLPSFPLREMSRIAGERSIRFSSSRTGRKSGWSGHAGDVSSFKSLHFVTYRCSGPQWPSWAYGSPGRRPCTISGHPCPGGKT
jgi:hypothetical protein